MESLWLIFSLFLLITVVDFINKQVDYFLKNAKTIGALFKKHSQLLLRDLGSYILVVYVPEISVFAVFLHQLIKAFLSIK